MFDMLVEQSIDLPAVLVRRVLEPQEHPNLVERHVERTAVTNERQSINVDLLVDPIVGLRAHRRRMLLEHSCNARH